MKFIRIITTFFLLGFCAPGHSQTNSFSPEWAYGVNGGLTFSKINFNSVLRVPQELLMQSSGGIVVRYISESHFGVQVELNYSQRGWKERTDTIHTNRYTRSTSYLELPFLTHIYFNLGKRVRFIFNLGPQIGYYTGAKEKEREINDDEVNTSYYDLPVQRRFDYGLKGAMGFEIRGGFGSIILDGRYYFGLSDVFNNTKGDLFQASHNQVIGVNLTYLFKAGKK